MTATTAPRFRTRSMQSLRIIPPFFPRSLASITITAQTTDIMHISLRCGLHHHRKDQQHQQTSGGLLVVILVPHQPPPHLYMMNYVLSSYMINYLLSSYDKLPAVIVNHYILTTLTTTLTFL